MGKRIEYVAYISSQGCMIVCSIENHGGYFYLNHADYDDAWVDIAPNVSIVK
jgi:hypothetical protein